MGEPEPATRAARLFDQAAALHRAGRLGDAVEAYRRAVQAKPDHIGALCNLGIALRQSGRVNDAIAAYRKALAVAPESADVQYNLGVVLSAVGQFDDAAEAFRHAIDLKPDFAQAHANLGNALQKAGRAEDAIAAYHQAVSVKPDHAGALTNLGSTLNKLGRHEEAAEALRRALAAEPGLGPALGHLAAALLPLERHDETEAAARRALALEPGNIEALTSLGGALKALGRGEELFEACRQSIAAQPDCSNAYMAMAEEHLAQGDPRAALAVCADCLAQNRADAWALSLKTTLLNELGEADALRDLADYDGMILRKRWAAAPGHASLEAFNASLARHITAHPSLIYEPDSQATRGGRHTGDLLVEPKGPVGALEQMICTAVDDYAREVSSGPGHRLPADPPARWRLKVWAVVLGQQGHQIPHIHPAAWLSGVYYAKVPEIVGTSAAAQAGWIEFGRPLLRHRVRAAPRVKAVQPEAGLMLLFPSHFLHRTLPFASDETRISVAFDVIPVGPRGGPAPGA